MRCARAGSGRSGPRRGSCRPPQIGEALRHTLPRLLVPSYALSVGYVIGDTHDKYQKAAPGLKGRAAVDTFMWQMAVRMRAS